MSFTFPLQISSIKKSTTSNEVYEKLVSFQPKPAKYETLTDLFRNIQKDLKLKSQPPELPSADDPKLVPVEESETSSNEPNPTNTTLTVSNGCTSIRNPTLSFGFQTAKNLLEQSVSMNKTNTKSLFGDSDEETGNSPKHSKLHKRESSRRSSSRDRKHKDKHERSRNRDRSRDRHQRDRSHGRHKQERNSDRQDKNSDRRKHDKSSHERKRLHSRERGEERKKRKHSREEEEGYSDNGKEKK